MSQSDAGMSYEDAWPNKYAYMTEPLQSPVAKSTLQEDQISSATYETSDNPSYQYVNWMLGELRVMTKKDAMVMTEFLTEHYESVVQFVEQYRLHDNSIYSKYLLEKGSALIKRLHLQLDDGQKLRELIKPIDETKETLNKGSWTTLGDGQCNWRSLAILHLGDEYYWSHIRLVAMSYAYITNPGLTLFDRELDYQTAALEDANEGVAPGCKLYKDWEFIGGVLEASRQHPHLQPGMVD